MANLLDRYGIVPDLSKKYSISFIDDFVDCSYRSFLTRFIGITSESGDIPRVFGSGCHRGLARVNKALQEKREACIKCQFPCKLNTPRKAEAMARTVAECRIKQILQEEFFNEFDDEFEKLAVEKRSRKKTSDEVTEKIGEHKIIGMNAMCSALFQRQPIGDVLLTERPITGELAGKGLIGVVDLILGIKEKALILDYKTAASAPESAFPLRQLALYIHMLEQMGLPVNGVGALYLLKKLPPKRITKRSKPFEQTAMLFMSLDKNRKTYENTIKHLSDDIDMIGDCISAGNFVRNRRSMFCPCDAAEYCENTAKLDKYVADGFAKKKEYPDQ
jgi:hypothetical protein